MAKKAVSFIENIQAYNKAIAAFVAGAIILFLQEVNFPVDDSFRSAIEVIVLAVIVWAVPNKK